MGLLKNVWQWLAFEEHSEPLKLIAEAVVTVIAACWAVKYLFSRRASQIQETAGSGVPSVPNTGWDHPRRFTGGGAIQAAREFGELAKKEPERVAALVLKLTPGENELPAGHALEGLSNSTYPKEQLYRLIEVLVGMGFGNPTFRHYAASTVGRALDKEHPLPDSLFRIMESWLEETDPKDYTEDKEGDSKIGSVLWGASYIQVLQSGNYPVLHALSRACLLSDPPNMGRWLDILEAQLERREDPEVWRALCAELRWLHLADKERAQAFLDRLFLRFPTVLGSVVGATLIARVQNWADEHYLEVWLSALRDGPWAKGATAYGELLLLRCAFHSESSWLQAKLEELRRVGSTGSRISAMRRGIAYSAAHLWGEQRARTLATDILVECMADDVEEVRDAASEVFRVMKILPRDSKTDRLLDAVAANPSVLRGTMQQMEGEHRERGLQIFERLKELDIHIAKETLEELDRRSLPRKQ